MSSSTTSNIDHDVDQSAEVTQDAAPEARLESGFGLVARAQNLIEPLVGDLGFDLVRVLMTGNENPRLQVMIERLDGEGLGVEDCVSVSRAISALMDVEDPIEQAYNLEVTSPGVDRPLTRVKDFARFEGYEAKLETHTAYNVTSNDGKPGLQRRFHGRLGGVEGDEILLLVDGKKGEGPATLGFAFADLQRAKMVITDDLLADAQSGVLPPIASAPQQSN